MGMINSILLFLQTTELAPDMKEHDKSNEKQAHDKHSGRATGKTHTLSTTNNSESCKSQSNVHLQTGCVISVHAQHAVAAAGRCGGAAGGGGATTDEISR
jgi:hypothetical protein